MQVLAQTPVMSWIDEAGRNQSSGGGHAQNWSDSKYDLTAEKTGCAVGLDVK